MTAGPSPLLCPREEKAEREAANTVAQLAYVTDVVRRGARALRESHIFELQRLAIDGIYPCAGRYRAALFDLEMTGTKHKPPPAALVPGLMLDMVERCNDERRLGIGRAAYALWRFNWIHPFPGGNGRTARAISYLILCMDFGGMLPGVPSIPGLIAADRDGYLEALRETDQHHLRLGDIPADGLKSYFGQLPMQNYLGELFIRQVSAGPGLWKLFRPMAWLTRRMRRASTRRPPTNPK